MIKFFFFSSVKLKLYNLMPKDPNLRCVTFYLPLILILTCFMFHTNCLYLFNIFCSPRLILVHLFWESRRTISDYMQKMNKPFIISTHTQTKRTRRRRRKKKYIPRFEPAPSRFPHQNSYCGLSMEPLGHNCFYTNMLIISLIWKLYIPVLNNRHIPK